MTLSAIKVPGYLLEFTLAYGVLGYLSLERWVPDGLFHLILSFFCIVFSLYYGIKGAVASVGLAVILVALTLERSILPFFSQYYLEASFLIAATMITGFIRSGMENKIIGTELANDIMNQRVERLTIELSKKDKALQDTFREILTDMESPRIMYQSIRRLEYIEDRETLFREILYILYSHCHVEKSCVYEVLSRNRFKKVAAFGATTLPKAIQWKDKKLPEIMRVAKIERQVIVPTRLNNQFVMAVPLISSSKNLLYIILIEEIRFINMNDALLNLLKASAFWMKNIIENHFHREEFLPISVFKSVIVYREDIYRKALRESIASHKKFKLPFACLRIIGTITEECCRRLSGMVRIHDEFFMASGRELIVLLTMITEENVPFVVRRLQEASPDLQIRAYSVAEITDG